MKGSCPTKNTLLIATQEAADAYARAVAELARNSGVGSAAEERMLSVAAELARKRSIKAHAALEAHISAHGCNDAA
jgi:hypothetical protein